MRRTYKHINSAKQASSILPYFVIHYEGIKAEDDEDALVTRKGKTFALALPAMKCPCRRGLQLKS
jgi:hypothetical protein